jgi:four helix bundle protein
MAKGDNTEFRLVGLAVAVLNLCERLPKTPEGSHIAGQLRRSETTGAPNYAEARASESGLGSIHQPGIVRKELDESRVWLGMIRQHRLVAPGIVKPVS